ncbi:MAG: cysteinyl-tRNA synthetase [Cirrosporium novae-zelandiae]|nr:MAG: cysteinyl-tRNA synthetase [Cirrosporium novae-zelandiae]
MARRNGTINTRNASESSKASSSSSLRSDDTVTEGIPGAEMSRATTKDGMKHRLQEDAPGPQFAAESSFPTIPSATSPAKKARSAKEFANYRRELSVLETGGPSSQSQSAAAAQNPHIITWTKDRPQPMYMTQFGNFFNPDSLDPQISPTFRPGTSRTGISDSPDHGYFGDERRPSVASNTTVSSQGSRSSTSGGRFHKRLQGFFGDEFPGHSQHGSETSLPINLQGGSRDAFRPRDRTNSVKTNGTADRPISPSSSRPRTPVPSSDVTPWVFQNPDDISQYGDAPIRELPTGPDKIRYAASESNAPIEQNHHKIHFPGHRHSRSKEETSKSKDISPGYPLRPTTSRDETSVSLRRLRDYGINPRSVSKARSSSPTPSTVSAMSRETQQDQRSLNGSAKRSLFDKLRRHKPAVADTLKALPGSSRSLGESSRQPRMARPEPSPGNKPGDRNASPFESQKGSEAAGVDQSQQRKDANKNAVHARFRGKRNVSYETGGGKDVKTRSGSEAGAENSLWDLDTDLDHMEGIISQPVPGTPPGNPIFAGYPASDEGQTGPKNPILLNETGAWDAPDSWAVKKVDETVEKLGEIDEEGIPQKLEEDTTPHCVRVFRVDSTFATLSTSANTTVADILQILGRKSFLQDELGNYQIIMRKHDLHRQLQPGERPIAMQRRLLEQAGYTSNDRIEDIGREDNSYLIRFTFVPTKLTGFYSLDRDPGFGKSQKFSHVDLQGRNLAAIPISLYQKSADIVSLNLSRNLALDVPKDFIQGCINLREIKYTGNEAWRLPPSLSLASRLTVLDISNNRLEQLEHAHLDQLSELISIKLSNNKLKYLPSYFGKFRCLRNLSLSSNSFEEVPEFLGQLNSLVELDISFNEIKTLPKLDHLVSLERLWATNNKLSGAFDDSFKNLARLKELDLRFNFITSIDVFSHLPRLEQLLVGHNAISRFEGTFNKLKVLQMDHNPTTRFHITQPIPTLTILNIASAKLSQLDKELFERIPNVTKLNLDKNHFSSIASEISKLGRLEHLSMAKNPLNNLPSQIGCLTELKFLNLRECNLKLLPPGIWFCLKLETLNISCNVLDAFPKFTAATAPPDSTQSSKLGTPATTPGLNSSPSFEELGKLEEFGQRRPSQASSGLASSGMSSSGFLGVSSGTSIRKASVASSQGYGARKVSRTPTEGTVTGRKDSSHSNRLATTFAGSLRNLYLADNRLDDDVFRELSILPELRVLNLSYNDLTDFPQGYLRRWPNLAELYLSGNELTSLPSDDLEDSSTLRVLHINGNRFQVLPAELCKVKKLATLDVGCNSLKYNVSNWPYDWNWNWNRNLKYLNFSGNKRLEIKPSISFGAAIGTTSKDLTSFNSLTYLRVLGLMDVTLTSPMIPDQTEDRRVRTTGSMVGAMAYGMADTLGRNEHLSTIDLVIPRFRSHEMETVIGMFDGQSLSSGGSKIAKYLHETFQFQFADELDRLRTDNGETPIDALRRTFLAVNKDLASAANMSTDEKELRTPYAHRGSSAAQVLSKDDLDSGGVATVLYLRNMELFVANVGDIQAMLMHTDGSFRFLTRKHDPAETDERKRIRDAGGYVSRHGKLNDILDVSRAFGYFQFMPSVMAAPHTLQTMLKEQDEMILLATKELWDFVTPDVVADVARSERGDLMRAAQKVRDLAIAFGATNKIMVMMIRVSDLKKRDRNRFRGQSMSFGNFLGDEQFLPTKRPRRARDGPADSTLARLDQEVDAPVGDVAIIFTDIKSSTALWETHPIAMRSAIKTHNDLMRRQLRNIGGYEVKTEGDAFMVSFQTATSALLWCFSMQNHLLDAEWPREILNCDSAKEVTDNDGNIIYRGLSVRMGIHWGAPVCELDPITKRMDYFGPMVNRASRISAVADGGQITVSGDFITEIHRALEYYANFDRSASEGSDESFVDDAIGQIIRRDLRNLSSQGFEIKDLGEQKLKGLENPELVYLMYPHALAGRVQAQETREEVETDDSADPVTLSRDSQLGIEADEVWSLWKVSLRLEMLCSALENPQANVLRVPEEFVLERMKQRAGEVTDGFLVNFMEHQVSRIETCISTLNLRHLVKPFNPYSRLSDYAAPISEIFQSLAEQLQELQALKERVGPDA